MTNAIGENHLSSSGHINNLLQCSERSNPEETANITDLKKSFSSKERSFRMFRSAFIRHNVRVSNSEREVPCTSRKVRLHREHHTPPGSPVRLCEKRIIGDGTD